MHHMDTKHLSHFIKHKCTLGNLLPENELMTMTMSKLISSIEENLLTILNRIHDCSGCILNQCSQWLHSCFMFNNREIFQQLGDMFLMLANVDFLISIFFNRVDCTCEHILCNINIETI